MLTSHKTKSILVDVKNKWKVNPKLNDLEVPLHLGREARAQRGLSKN